MLKIIMAYIMIANMVYGYINIYPSFFYKSLKKEGTYETFVLTNRSDCKLKYRVYFEEKFLPNIQAEVYPKSIILNPYESKEIKVLLTPKEAIKPGVYDLFLVIKEVEALGEKRKKIYSMLKLKLSTYYGNIRPKINGDIEIKGQKIDVKIINSGMRPGVFSIYLLNEKKEWRFLDSFILKEKEQWIKEYLSEEKYSQVKIIDENNEEYYLKK